VAVHDSVAVCGEVPKVTLVGLTVHVKPVGVNGFAARPTDPDPAFAVMVSVHDPEPPGKIWLGDTGPQLTDRPLWKLNEMAAVVWLRVPSVPVTVTVKVPVVDAVHDSVEVCGDVPNVTLVGVRVHVRPAGVDADTVNATVPVRPLTAVTVIVEVPELPGVIVVGDTAPAAIVKSTTVNVIAAVVWDSVPSVPVTVTVYVAAVPDVQLRVEVCGEVPKVTLVGVRVHVSPVGVEAETVSATVPVRPLSAASEIVEVPEEPASIWAGETAPAVILKSTTLNVIAAVVWDNVPSVPVTVTV
jgi:hypothetical protein